MRAVPGRVREVRQEHRHGEHAHRHAWQPGALGGTDAAAEPGREVPEKSQQGEDVGRGTDAAQRGQGEVRRDEEGQHQIAGEDRRGVQPPHQQAPGLPFEGQGAMAPGNVCGLGASPAADHRDTFGQDGQQERADDPDDEDRRDVLVAGLRLRDRYLRQHDRRGLHGVLRRHLGGGLQSLQLLPGELGEGGGFPQHLRPVGSGDAQGEQRAVGLRRETGRVAVRDAAGVQFLGRVARLERPDQHVRRDDQRTARVRDGVAEGRRQIGNGRGVEQCDGALRLVGHRDGPVQIPAREKAEQGEGHHEVPTPAHDRPDVAQAHEFSPGPVPRDRTSGLWPSIGLVIWWRSAPAPARIGADGRNPCVAP